MKVDAEKVFDSINHYFLMCVLKKFVFGNQFRKWLQILMKNLDGGKTRPYFKLERGARQGDPILTYLFIIAFESVFFLIKVNPNIDGLQFFSQIFLYFAYADYTTFFLSNKKSATEVIKKFDNCPLFSGIKISNDKCEIAGIGVKKLVQMAICGMECLDSRDDVINILYIDFSYNN